MRPLIVFSDVTVDGFMTGPANDLSFMVEDPRRDEELTGELMAAADTIVWGRVSFPDSGAYWTTATGPLADWMNATPKVVLSSGSDLDVTTWPNSTLAAGNGVAEVRRLKRTTGAAIVAFGGLRTIRSLVAADLVDEYWLKVNPVVIGRGGSMFADIAGRRPLALRSARSYPAGSVALVYTVA